MSFVDFSNLINLIILEESKSLSTYSGWLEIEQNNLKKSKKNSKKIDRIYFVLEDNKLIYSNDSKLLEDKFFVDIEKGKIINF